MKTNDLFLRNEKSAAKMLDCPFKMLVWVLTFILT